MSALTVDFQELVYPRPFSRFQDTVLALCFLVDAAEGFDTARDRFHRADAEAPRQPGAHRDRLQLQRPQRRSSEIRDRNRRIQCTDEPRLRLARLRGEMRPLRPYHQNLTRGYLRAVGERDCELDLPGGAAVDRTPP